MVIRRLNEIPKKIQDAVIEKFKKLLIIIPTSNPKQICIEICLVKTKKYQNSKLSNL